MEFLKNEISISYNENLFLKLFKNIYLFPLKSIELKLFLAIRILWEFIVKLIEKISGSFAILAPGIFLLEPKQ